MHHQSVDCSDRDMSPTKEMQKTGMGGGDVENTHYVKNTCWFNLKKKKIGNLAALKLSSLK